MDAIYINKSTEPVNRPPFEMPEINGNAEVRVTVKADDGSGSISFHNISYTVEQRMCFKKRPPKVILNNVRLVAICTYKAGKLGMLMSKSVHGCSYPCHNKHSINFLQYL